MAPQVQEAGLEGLAEEERNQYVLDPPGFISSVRPSIPRPYPTISHYPNCRPSLLSAIHSRLSHPSLLVHPQVKDPRFKLYAERYVLPTFADRADEGKVPQSATASKFFASRILWDESMATVAARHLKVRRAVNQRGHIDTGASSWPKWRRWWS